MANFVIDSEEALKEKIDLISNLIDIKTAFQIKSKRAAKRKEAKAKAEKEKREKDKAEEASPIDEDYASLRCKMEPMAASHEDYKMID